MLLTSVHSDVTTLLGTILLADHTDGCLRGLAALVTASDSLPATKVRGTIVGVAGILLIL